MKATYSTITALLDARNIPYSVIRDSQPTILVPILGLMMFYDAREWAWKAFAADLSINTPIHTINALEAILERLTVWLKAKQLLLSLKAKVLFTPKVEPQPVPQPQLSFGFYQ